MAEDIIAFQAGREAAIAGKARDGRRSADWLEGFDQVAGYRECHCIPGHRSNHVTHRCEVCGFADFELEDGKPIPPCQPSSG